MQRRLLNRTSTEEHDVIQLGKRSTLCTLLAVAALSISANALAQNPPAPTPAPTDPAAPADPNAPAPAVDPNAPAPAPAPPPPSPPPPAPAPAEPPKVTFPTMAGPMLRLSDLFAIRPGILLQFWGALAQDPIPETGTSDPGEYAKNLYLRRARFYLFGSFAKNVTWFMLWESGNLGLATQNADGSVNKNYTLFNFQDAWVDIRLHKALSVQAGLMLIPFTRNILQSTSSYWAIDIGAVSASYINATATNVLRDGGVQVKVNAANGKFEARGLVSQGVKIADIEGGGRAPGKNSPRLTGYLQYNFFEPEAGYVFNGQYFGRRKVAGIALGGDYQAISSENPYFATSATLFAAIPLKGADPKNGGDEVGGQVEYLHFHGGRVVPSSAASALGKRDGVLVELGYYNKASKFSVFGKYEGVFIEGDVGKLGNTSLFGGGAKYFFAEQALNLTLQYSRTSFPNQMDTVRTPANVIQAQLQLAYF
jgi:Phosphate-selective porin O and P